ncbi:hypothetical protein, partial [Thiocapsa marina]|uniref:Prevent-host-death family protein n=1 Tax=Thiocapsa marina 5811 TaxID=768671 RepID=F9UII4_9GAMM
MNRVPTQEIKRRGIAAADEALHNAPVDITEDNRPSSVVLTEAAYAELQEAQ